MSDSGENCVGKLKVGILGFGSLGQFMYDAIVDDASISSRFEIAWVWNRSSGPLERISAKEKRVSGMDKLEKIWDECDRADIVVEVSHPSISVLLAASMIRSGANFVIGSPTALADVDAERTIRETALDTSNSGACYIPAGALWGASDLQVGCSTSRYVLQHYIMIQIRESAFRLFHY